MFQIFTWAHSVPRTQQTLGPSLPLPKKMRFPEVDLHLSVPFAAAVCLAWEASNSSLAILLPLWGRMSQITQARSSPRVGLYSTGSAESEKMDLILNNCVNVIEIHVFFQEKGTFHSQCWIECTWETQKVLDCPIISQFFFSFFFSYLDFFLGKKSLVRNFVYPHKYDFLNLPRGSKEAKCDYSASELSSCGDSSKGLKVLPISELQYAFQEVLRPVAFIRRKSHRRDFHSGTRQGTVLPAVSGFPGPALMSLCLNKFSLIFPLLLLHQCCYPGNYAPSACVLPSKAL